MWRKGDGSIRNACVGMYFAHFETSCVTLVQDCYRALVGACGAPLDARHTTLCFTMAPRTLAKGRGFYLRGDGLLDVETCSFVEEKIKGRTEIWEGLLR